MNFLENKNQFKLKKIILSIVVILIALTQSDLCLAAKDARAKCLSDWNDVNIALRNCDEAIQRSPGEAVLWYSRARVWIQNENYDKAIQDSNEALRLDSTFAPPFYTKGIAYEEKENWELALENFKKYRYLNPTDLLGQSAVERLTKKLNLKTNKRDSFDFLKTFNTLISLYLNEGVAFYLELFLGFLLLSLIFVLYYYKFKKMPSNYNQNQQIDGENSSCMDISDNTAKIVTSKCLSNDEIINEENFKNPEDENTNLILMLEKIGELRDKGLLTADQFEKEKKRILEL